MATGLLGDSWDDPRTSMMLALASGLLGGRGNLAQNLGAGLMGGVNAYQDARKMQMMAQQQAMQQKLMQAQIGDVAAQEEQRKANAAERAQVQRIRESLFGGTATGALSQGAQQPSTNPNPSWAPAQRSSPVDTGPTPTNAARMETQQQGRIAALNPDQVMALASVKGFEKLPEIWKMAREGFSIKPGWTSLPNGEVTYIPDVKVDSNGNVVVVGLNGNKEITVGVPQGALQARFMQGLAGNLANAATSLKDIQGPQGEPRVASTLQLLNAAGGLNGIINPMLGGTAGNMPNLPSQRGLTQGQAAPSIPIGVQAPAVTPAQVAPRTPLPTTTAPAPQGGGGLGVAAGPTLRAKTGFSEAGSEEGKLVGGIPQKKGALDSTIRSLTMLRSLNEQDKTFAAAGAEWKVGFERVLQGLGLPSDIVKTANSELFLARIGELLKDRLASKDYGSGSGISNLDLIAGEIPLPSLTRSREGRALIIDALIYDAQWKRESMDRMKAYFDKNGSLSGYVPEPQVPVISASRVKGLGLDGESKTPTSTEPIEDVIKRNLRR